MFDDRIKEFICDWCGALAEVSDFKTGLEEIKADGWRTQKTMSGDWVHYCPECKTRDKNV